MKKLFSILVLVTVAVFAVFADNNVAQGILGASFFPAAASAQGYRNFFRAINLAAKEWGVLAAPGDLRSEVAISNTTSTYSFTIRDIQMNKTTFPQSQGVQDNDIFVVYAHSIFWDNRVSGTGKIQLQTYPNPYVANAAGITAADLYAFYSGQFNIQVGSTEFIKQLDSSAFLTIPFAQQTSATDNTQFDIYAALKCFASYPLYSGKADNKVTLNINTAPSLDVVGDSGQSVLTYFCKGIVLNNGANNMETRPGRDGRPVSFYEYVLQVLEQLG